MSSGLSNALCKSTASRDIKTRTSSEHAVAYGKIMTILRCMIFQWRRWCQAVLSLDWTELDWSWWIVIGLWTGLRSASDWIIGTWSSWSSEGYTSFGKGASISGSELT